MRVTCFDLLDNCWCEKPKSFKIYEFYSLRKQTYKELKTKYGKSPKTLRKHFDSLVEGNIASFPFINEPINVVFDATFFGRNYGVLVFRANGKNIYWEEIISESMNTISRALGVLDAICIGEYKSFTIDGRRGVIKFLESYYSEVPIQFCQFRQKQIIRCYTTNNPQTDCGKALKSLMKYLTIIDADNFLIRFKVLQVIFAEFLKERNEHNAFKHKRLRSVVRSLRTNLSYLFTHQKFDTSTLHVYYTYKCKKN